MRASAGHSFTQAQHLMQRAGSLTGIVPDMASVGHTSEHIPHWIHFSEEVTGAAGVFGPFILYG